MNYQSQKPLADRVRPHALSEFLGQKEIVGPKAMLKKAIESDKVPSLILWGPPGTGKTTLAHIIAKSTKAEFIQLSAVAAGVKELREIVAQAEKMFRLGQKTILFIDEVHRWSKSQQDYLLPVVENGVITLIGATTENPGFEIRSALLSRCRVFVMEKLSEKQLVKILNQALVDPEKGLGGENVKIKPKVIEKIAAMSHGDARRALNALEYAVSLNKDIDSKIVDQAFQKAPLNYDKNGDEHYNIISALHKSMRGSDSEAALYWLVRMLEAGEEPLYIARRIVRFASEDIGLQNSRALEQAVAAYQACHFLGMPECNLALAQAVVYMAKCDKSNKLYSAYRKAQKDIKRYGDLPVPEHLRNASNDLMRDLNYGQDYKYSPDFDYKEKQNYLPEKLKNRKYLS